MKHFGIKAAAALCAAVVCLAALFAGCGGASYGSGVKLTKAEEERVISLARSFRIYGEYDSEAGFELRRYEYLVYSLSCWNLPESEVAGFGKLSFSEADALVSGTLGGSIDSSGLLRTKYKANEIQVIYAIGENYFVQRSDDGAYGYEIETLRVLTGEDGARTGVAVTVKVTGGEGDFSLAFELLDSAESVFSVKKCEIHSYI